MTAEQLLARMLKFAEACLQTANTEEKVFSFSPKCSKNVNWGSWKRCHNTDLEYCVYQGIAGTKMPSESGANLIPENLTLNSTNSINQQYLLNTFFEGLWDQKLS